MALGKLVCWKKLLKVKTSLVSIVWSLEDFSLTAAKIAQQTLKNRRNTLERFETASNVSEKHEHNREQKVKFNARKREILYYAKPRFSLMRKLLISATLTLSYTTGSIYKVLLSFYVSATSKKVGLHQEVFWLFRCSCMQFHDRH